jgi:hypothetical protein
MIYTNTCEVCQTNFESKRPATYCSSTCRSKVSRGDVEKPNPENIFEILKRVQAKFRPDQITKEVLTKETGINYSFVPTWLRHGKNIDEIRAW